MEHLFRFMTNHTSSIMSFRLVLADALPQGSRLTRIYQIDEATQQSPNGAAAQSERQTQR